MSPFHLALAARQAVVALRYSSPFALVGIAAEDVPELTDTLVTAIGPEGMVVYAKDEDGMYDVVTQPANPGLFQ